MGKELFQSTGYRWFHGVLLWWVFCRRLCNGDRLFIYCLGYGKWDNRIKYRLWSGCIYYGGITKGAKKFNKLDYPIIELQSVEPSLFVYTLCRFRFQPFFYGTMYNDAKAFILMLLIHVLKYTLNWEEKYLLSEICVTGSKPIELNQLIFTSAVILFFYSKTEYSISKMKLWCEIFFTKIYSRFHSSDFRNSENLFDH